MQALGLHTAFLVQKPGTPIMLLYSISLILAVSGLFVVSFWYQRRLHVASTTALVEQYRVLGEVLGGHIDAVGDTLAGDDATMQRIGSISSRHDALAARVVDLEGEIAVLSQKLGSHLQRYYRLQRDEPETGDDSETQQLLAAIAAQQPAQQPVQQQPQPAPGPSRYSQRRY